jgi:hypothetical protein
LFRWELEDLAREQLAEMPSPVQLALSDFMDAVVIVDPAEYQRRPEEPARPLRTLPFGEVGLVTFWCMSLMSSCWSRGSSGPADLMSTSP